MTNGHQGAQGVQLVRWIGLAMVLPAFVAVALLAKDAAIVVERINESALKREMSAVDHGIKLLGEVNATELLSQTMWDTAFRNVVLSKRPDWIRKNMGKDALASEGQQQLYIVEPSGAVSFSSEHGAAPPRAVADELVAVTRGPIERARGLYRIARAADEGFGERQPGNMTDGIYVNDLAQIGGMPAMITVSPFTPDIEDLDTPAEPTLLVGVRLMTRDVLDRLESLSHVEGLDHAEAGVVATDEAPLHTLRDTQGNVVTHVTWSFSSPGQSILRAAMPAIAGSLALIVLLTALATFTMHRLTRRLAESERAAVYASRHDAATGLANRGWFMRVFGNVLAPGAKAREATHAVMLIDCDYFKSVNDTLGHAAGDAVLAAIAERLKGLGDKLAIAARLGGDEFALVSAPLADASAAAGLMRHVETALMRPVVFEQHIIPVSVSVGAAVFATPSSDSIDVWLARADSALYRAKRDGRGCARLYDSARDSAEATPADSVRTPHNDRGTPPERAA